MYYRDTMLALHHPWALWPKRVTLLRICVSHATSFEMSFLRIVLSSTSVPVLCPSPRVGGCYIHPLSGTVFVNDTTRALEGQCLDRTWMDGCLRHPDEISDTRDRSWWHDRVSYDSRRHPRLGMVSRHMDHVDGDRDDKMRCDIVLRDLGLKQRQGRAKWPSLV